jgi:hypothetical protein
MGTASQPAARHPILECDSAANPPVMGCQVPAYQADHAVGSPGSLDVSPREHRPTQRAPIATVSDEGPEEHAP